MKKNKKKLSIDTRTTYPLVMDEQLYDLVGEVTELYDSTKANIMREALRLGLILLQLNKENK